MAITTQEIVLTMIDSFEAYLADRANLFDYNRTAPVLFEDEISEIIRTIPDESEITCYDANEEMEHFRVHDSKYMDMDGHTVPKDKVISIIYNYLESECGSVFIDDTFITDIKT